MNYILICLCSLLVVQVSLAQGLTIETVKQDLDSMFVGLDKSKVPTGYLWDTSVNLVDADSFNGQELTDSNYVDLATLFDIIVSLNSASVGGAIIDPASALNSLTIASSHETASVGILFRPYNYILPNALTDNLIDYSNGIVSDAYRDGVWQNPYGEEVLFAFATGNDGVVNESLVTFSFSYIDTLSISNLDLIRFDPGDGNGYRSVNANETLSIFYSSSGFKHLKMEVVFNGHSYVAQSLLEVKFLGAMSSSTSYYLKEPIQADYGGKTYYAQISYPINRQGLTPLIISEGFDPWDISNNEDQTGYSGFTNISNFEDVLDDYDIYYIDWKDYGADIRANAEVFKNVIRWVNLNKLTNTSNIVLGQSMGGLIARYALRMMELSGELHQTSTFISHDVPYRGANVPIGLLFAYWDLFDLTDGLIGAIIDIKGYGEMLRVAKELGTYVSVRQMLPLYVNADRQYDNSEYVSLHSELDAIGYPRGDAGQSIDVIAIINGGTTSNGTMSRYSQGDRLLNIDASASTGALTSFIELIYRWAAFDISKLLHLIPGKSTLRLKYQVYPYVSNASTVLFSELTYKKKFLWLINGKTEVLGRQRYYSPSSGVPIDAVRSSFYAPPINDTLFSAEDHHFWLGKYKMALDVKDTISFIPMASAFDSNDYYRDFLANHPVPGVDTPFTSYIISDTATFHTSLFTGIDNWLETVSESDVVGPDLAFTGDVFSLTGPASSESHIWSVSDPSIATIDPFTGEITAVGSGLVEVAARLESANSAITKRKKVLVGLPETIIQYDNTGSTYTVYTRPVEESVSAYWNDKSLKDSVTYNWSLIKWPSEGTPEVTPFYANDSISFVTDPNIVKIAANVEIISREDTLALFEYILIPDQYIHNLRNISVEEATEEITFIYNLNEIPMTLSNSYDPCIILRNNPAADSEIVPARIEVAGIDFPLFGPYTQNGNEYYIWRLFISPRLPFWEQLPYMTVMLNIRAAEDAILIRIFDEEDNIVQILSVPKYVLHVFPL